MAVFDGDNNDNIFNGTAGADTFNLFGGDDLARPGAGADIINGGSGTDIASYFFASSAVWANLASGGGLGDAQGDVYNSVEHLFGSAFDDIFVGSNAIGETLSGADGNDILKGSAGSDVLQGGGGSDTANYEGSDAAVVIDALNETGFGGDAAGDSYNSIEIWVGSDFNDTFFGRDTAETFSGGAGNDVLKGSGGADSLAGGGGDDVVDYSSSASAVSIALTGTTGSGGDAQGDVLAGVEGLRGSAHDDGLFGDDNANELQGNGGADIIKGAGGGDTLRGDAGNDTLLGESGNDLLFGGDSTDRLDGGTGNDVLDGGLGNDRYIVDAAGDTIQNEIGFASGGGIDTVESSGRFLPDLQPGNPAPAGRGQPERRRQCGARKPGRQ